MNKIYIASWYGPKAIVGGEFDPEGLEQEEFTSLSDAKTHAFKNATKFDVAGYASVVDDNYLHTNELSNGKWSGWTKRLH